MQVCGDSKENITSNTKYLSNINFVINEMNLYFERISLLDSGNPRISVRASDKRNILYS